MNDTNKKPKKALIAMSGGVDSSVAAYLMREKGYECLGCTMRLYDNGDVGVCNYRTCCSQRDIEDASEVAFDLGMPYEVVDYTVDFKDKIIDKFVRTYENGGTPNPCIDCNKFMKFDSLLHTALARGMEYIVTGHYARIDYNNNTGRYELKRALDDSKDQSYVLYNLTQEELAHIQFPLGEMTKDKVREIAEAQGFVNARKRDSQDICFVPDGDYASFIEGYTGKKFEQGNFVDANGKILGTHNGYIRYTIGQRKGLGIAAESPYYVSDIDVETNTVTLTHGDELYSREIWANDINLISVAEIAVPMRITAKIRYRHKDESATVVQVGNELKVVFDEPQRAATKGQSLVIYDGDKVVGGGIICRIVHDK